MKRLLAIMVMVFPSVATAQMPPPPPPHELTVSGQAHTEVVPDQAVLNVSVVSRHLELEKAKQDNNVLTNKVREIALDLDIPEKYIATSNIFVSPEYKHSKQGRELQGYRINRSLRITMDRIDIHERLLSEVLAAGVDQVDGVQFIVSDQETHAQALRAEAVKDARAKAEVLAKAAGVELGKPMRIAQGGSSHTPPMPMQARAMHLSAMESSSVAPTLPGLVRLEQDVTITYEIR